jgi:hypothetical protein
MDKENETVAAMDSQDAEPDMERAQSTLRHEMYAREAPHLTKIVGEMRQVLLNGPIDGDICARGYQHFLQHYHEGSGFIARMATFHPSYFEEHLALTPVPMGDFQIVSPNKTGGCVVLYATLDQLEAARKGRGLPDVAYILIHETAINQIKRQSDDFLAVLGHTHSEQQMEYQCYLRSDPDAPLTSTMRVADVLKNHIHTLRRPYSKGKTQPPLNFLNISGEVVSAGFVESHAVSILGLTLLPHLDAKHRQRNHAQRIGKQITNRTTLVDGKSCGAFQLLAEAGTISMWHMDVMASTWAQVVSGHKAWCIVDRPGDAGMWSAFKDSKTGGMAWQPPQGSVKMIPLAAGDTLIMMPGKFTPHMPISYGDSFTHMIGGQVWPKGPEYLDNLLKAQQYLLENNATVTNENAPRQLPDFFNELQVDMKESLDPTKRLAGQPLYEESHRDQLATFITEVRPLLACNCNDADCSTSRKCPCYSRSSELNLKDGTSHSVSHTGGCTAWCHGGKRSDPSSRDCLRKKPRSTSNKNRSKSGN